jgi:glucokinase
MTGPTTGPLVVGIDLGGTKILAGVVDRDHHILGRAKRTTPAKEGGPAILAAVVGCVDDALMAADLSREHISAVGMGSPGPLDVKAGVILFSANMNVKNYPIGPEVAAQLGRPVLLRNDVRVGGYGEYRLGAGRGYRNMIAAFVGTGIGGCVIQGGEIIAGTTGNAAHVAAVAPADAWKHSPAKPRSAAVSIRPCAKDCRRSSARKSPAAADD